MPSKSISQSTPDTSSKSAKTRSQKAGPPATEADSVEQRRVKPLRYKSFRLSKSIKSPRPDVAGSFALFGRSMRLVLRHWKIFSMILAIYFVLTIVFVKGFGSYNSMSGIKEALLDLLQGGPQHLIAGLAIFGALVGSTGSTSGMAGSTYQALLLVMFSLIIIWTLRQLVVGSKVRLSDSLYKSSYPLVQFVLTLLVIGLQMIPLMLANFLYTRVIVAGVAVTAPEKAVWSLLIVCFAIWALYMISASIFALYIVTLPGMRPMQAMHAAHDLVRFRRWIIMRKVLFLPFILLVLGAVVMLPVIFVFTKAAEWVFLVVSLFALIVSHSYMYHLYRELIKESKRSAR